MVKINLKIIIPIFLLIALVWAGNFYVFLSSSLDKPIMLKSYLAYPLVENQNFHMRYITNRYEDDSVVMIRFPEIDSQVYYNNVGEEPVANGNYKLITITVDINTIFIDGQTRLVDADIQEPISIKKVELITQSNKKYTYDIGEIQLFKENEISHVILNGMESMSTSEGYSKFTYKLESEITINKIESPMLDRIPKICSLEINQYPYSSKMTPIFAQDQIDIMLKFKSNDEVSKEYRFAEYFFPVVFYGIDKTGKSCQIYQDIYSQPNIYFSLRDIRKLKEESR